MRLGVMAIGVSLCLVGLCSAQTSHASIRKNLNVPAEELSPALQTVATTYEFQVLYPTQIVKDLKTQGASGSLTSDEALTKVLSGTGLLYKYLDANTVTVYATGAAAAAGQDQTNNTQDDSKEAGKKSSQEFRVAQVDQGKDQSPSSLEKPDENSDKESSKQKDQTEPYRVNTPEILIVGSRIMNVDVKRTEDDVQPYYILDSQMIEQSGATNVEDFLKQRLTMNTVAQAAAQQAPSNNLGGVSSSINLRGLGTNETLILLDGRRIAAPLAFGDGLQPDINGIPLSAIERIEILPSSASAIYGGAALGGVVNIILKRNFQGGDVQYSLQNTFNASAPLRNFGATYGFSLGGGNTQIMLAGNYSDGEPLHLEDREGIFQRGISTILRNNPGGLYNSFAPFPGATPNISSRGFDSSGNQLNLFLKNGTPLNSPITSIPLGSAPGSNLSGGLLSNAGTYNLNLAPGIGTYGLQSPFGTVPRTKSFMVTVRQELTSSLDVFTDFLTTSNAGRSVINPFGAGFFLVPSTAPTSPFQQDVVINFPSTLSTPFTTDSVTQNITVGLLARLAGDWRSELDYTWSRSSVEYAYDLADQTAFGTALANGTVNPFVDTIAHPLNLVPYLASQTFGGPSTLNDFALRASGSVGSLPWGRPTLTVGLEHRKEGSDNAFANTIYPLTPANTALQTTFGHSQSTDSLYAEVQVPLISQKNSVPFAHSLDLQLAGRSERYTVYAGTPFVVFVGGQEFGPPQGVHQTIRYTSTNPTIGLKFEPVKELILRASYARAFLPPTVGQLLPTTQPDCVGGPCVLITDPKNGQTYNINTISGGNPSLTPQSSRDWHFGLIWEPTVAPLDGLRTDLEYYRTTQPNYIVVPSAQQILNDPAFAARVTRDPATGLITLVNTSYINATKWNTSGWVGAIDYRKPTTLGTFNFRVAGTVIESEKRQYSIDAPLAEFVGYPADGGEAKVKANATLGWERRNWRFGWTSTYYGSYRQAGSPGDPFGVGTFITSEQGGFSISSQIYHEIFGSYSTDTAVEDDGLPRHLLSNLTITFGIKNLFNTVPPFDALYDYYYSPYGNVRLREYRISIRKGF